MKRKNIISILIYFIFRFHKGVNALTAIVILSVTQALTPVLRTKHG